MIIAGGVAAGMYGTGCVDHDFKYTAAVREVNHLESELSEEEAKWRWFEFEQKNRLWRRDLCKQARAARPTDKGIQEYCEDNEKKYQQREEEYKYSVPGFNYYTQKLFEAEFKRNHHAGENITSAGYAVLALLVAGVGYAVKKRASR